MTNDEVLNVIVTGGADGYTSKELIGSLGEQGFWKAITRLSKDGLIFSKKKHGVNHYITRMFFFTKPMQMDGKWQ